MGGIEERKSMSKIGFIGLGHMGLPMVINLLKKGHQVTAFDLDVKLVEEAKTQGATPSQKLTDVLLGTDIIVSMLPEGKHSRAVYLGDDGLLSAMEKPYLIADCSTIDVPTAREITKQAVALGHRMVDAPVSGGVTGAAQATLTFMVGGEDEVFEEVKPILNCMGKNIFHAGGSGTGQAAKICNNMMLAIHMIGTAEGFKLADHFGLSHDKLFEITSVSSAQCWSLTSYCPVPGPVPTAPSNRDYTPGFTAAMMLKDLKLAMEGADPEGIGQKALEIYQRFCDAGKGQKDFSGVVALS